MPEVIVYYDDQDSLRCKIISSEVTTITVLDPEDDTLSIDCISIDKIVEVKTNVDVTPAYIDRIALKNELAKRVALEKREKIKSDVKAGIRKKADLRKEPIALLSSSVDLDQKKIPFLRITVLNLSSKPIAQFRARITCFNNKGKPALDKKTKTHIFEAVSKIPIMPDDEFGTALSLKNRPAARRVKAEIISVVFKDKTTWNGCIEEISL